uniref:dihydropteroate synthase n=1 Tax=Eubacterium pyruvativorans TaxID=155865 RepID=UPI0019670D3A
MAEAPEAAAGSKSAAAPESAEASEYASPECRGICSASKVAVLDGRVNVIGERINPTGKKRFQQALRSRDMNYVTELAIQQQEAGADILDINVGVPGLPEAELMAEVVQAVQSVTDLPLQID